jgi:glucosamine--fructose-6-phosphate aminotransferase (isomerizing)
MAQSEELQGYPHWMLKEIYEQPRALEATMARYVQGGAFVEEVVAPVRDWLRAQTAITFAASGSSRHASMVGAAALQSVTSLPVQVEYASEYIYRSAPTQPATGMIVLSQSGETVDTLAALRGVNEMGGSTLAITNVATSSMAKEATVAMPTFAGVERAVPATKSFTTQLLVLEILTCLACEAKGTLSPEEVSGCLQHLAALPQLIAEQLPEWEHYARAIAEHFRNVPSVFLLGRGPLYPMACEGALKLKESAYLHAEAYPAGEWKHGPNAMSTPETPLLVIAAYAEGDADSELRYDRTVQLMRDMCTQGTPMIAIANRGDDVVQDLVDVCISITPTSEALLPISVVVPLQLLSYALAVERGIDVDSPRNLVKAVRAE